MVVHGVGVVERNTVHNTMIPIREQSYQARKTITMANAVAKRLGSRKKTIVLVVIQDIVENGGKRIQSLKASLTLSSTQNGNDTISFKSGSIQRIQ